MITPRSILLSLIIISTITVHGQINCRLFTDYKNEIKVWAKAVIDSLIKSKVDTIMFYGVGIPESGRMAYSKIIWSANGIVTQCEIKAPYRDGVVQLTAPSWSRDTTVYRKAIKFYSDYRLDTVTTNPRELRWQSHDYIHFVYSRINGVETCFAAEEYLLRDYWHLRSRWIGILNDDTAPDELGH